MPHAGVPKVRFVIIATQRTGTMLLRSCLSSHPQIDCAGSIFPQVKRLSLFQTDRTNSRYRHFRSDSLRQQLAHWVDRTRLIHACLDDFFAEPTDATAKGFKASYNHLDRYPAVVAWLQQNDIHVIHLIRDNLLKRYLSSATKRVRGFAHATSPLEPVKIRVQIDKLIKDLVCKHRQVQQHRRFFENQPYFEVSYESFSRDRSAETQRILRFLEVDESIPLVTDQVKMNPDTIEQIVENYDELVRALRGTPFEKYLDDGRQ